jgi:hypothetical protein
MPRPDYLNAYVDRPQPSSVAPESRTTNVYRCRRLRGLLNLYHGALEYTLHCASDWTLGQAAYAFRLTEGDLWLLGIETVGDLASATSTSLLPIAESVQATKRGESGAFGSFNPRVRVQGDPEKGFRFKSHSRAGSDASPLLFDENDIVNSALFYSPECGRFSTVEWLDRLPWLGISTALRKASNYAELFLQKCGAKWDGPFYLNFEHGGQLLKYLRLKRVDDETALVDLEQHRLGCITQIELALRQAFEDEAAIESVSAGSQSSEHNWRAIIGASRQMLQSLRSTSGTVQRVMPSQTSADAFHALDVGKAIGHPANIARFNFARDPRSDFDFAHTKVDGMLHTLYANEPGVRLAALRLWKFYASDVVTRLLDPQSSHDHRQDAVAELVSLTEKELSEIEAAIDQLATVTRQSRSGIESSLPNSPPSTPLASPTTYLSKELCDELGISLGTLNKYAKAANVATPGRGQRNYRYSSKDRISILSEIAKSASESTVVKKAKDLLTLNREEITTKSQDHK